MLDTNQIIQVAIAAAVGILVIIILYYTASFILNHIVWVLIFAVVGAIVGFYYLREGNN
jgi:hypothetical protein